MLICIITYIQIVSWFLTHCHMSACIKQSWDWKQKWKTYIQAQVPWKLDEPTFDLSLFFPLYGPFIKVRLKWKVSSTNFYGPWARHWVSVQSIRTFLGNLLSIKKKIDQIKFFFWVHLSYLLSSWSITVMKYI